VRCRRFGLIGIWLWNAEDMRIAAAVECFVVVVVVGGGRWSRAPYYSKWLRSFQVRNRLVFAD